MDMTMSSIRSNRSKVVSSVQRRKRWTSEQKLEFVKKPMNQAALFLW
jgi:hypothetical protein